MEKLNLNQFLQDPAEHLGHYTLHAVLVHSGKCRASFIEGKKDQKNELNQLLHVCMLPYSFHCSFRMSKYNMSEGFPEFLTSYKMYSRLILL